MYLQLVGEELIKLKTVNIYDTIGFIQLISILFSKVYPNDLMQVRLNILPYSECRSRWGTYASRQICAGLLGI